MKMTVYFTRTKPQVFSNKIFPFCFFLRNATHLFSNELQKITSAWREETQTTGLWHDFKKKQIRRVSPKLMTDDPINNCI